MLCIAYTSKAKLQPGQTTIPDSLTEILSLARKKNEAQGITSALLYRDGMFLQIIEGEANQVDALFNMICNDERHEQVEKFIDIPISDRAFTGKYIHLLLSLHEDAQLINFIADNKEIILSSSSTDSVKQKLAHFGCSDLEDLQPSNHSLDEDFFTGQSFMLKQEVEIDWFEIGMLEPEIAIAGIHLSNKLLHNVYTYKELLKCNEFGSINQLNSLLSTLNSTGHLVKTKEAPVKKNVFKSKQSKNKKASFRQKLLSWLKKSDGI